MRHLPLIMLVGTLVGCAAKVMILQSPVVSMKKNNAPKGASLAEGKAVNVEWCQGDDPIVENDDGSNVYGMIDQAIYKAHQEAKADFFMNTRFYQQSDCILMQANVAKLSGSGGGDAEEADDAKPSKKGKKKGHHKKKKKKGA